MRADDREEEAEFSEFKCDDTSVIKFMSESESMLDKKDEAAEFLGNFRREFLHQSASKDRRKKT